MRILLLNDFGTLQGGAETQILALRDGLRAAGHDVKLLTSSAPYEGLPFHSDARCFGTTTFLRSLSQTFNLSAYRILRRVLRDFQPDVVHTRSIMWQLSPAVWQPLCRIPTIWNPVDYKPLCPRAKKILPDGQPCTHASGVACLRYGCIALPPQWALEMAQQRVWQRFRRHVDCVVAQSEGAKEVLEGLGVAVDEVIHNGAIDAAPRPELAGAPVVGFAGYLSQAKGPDILLDAFRHVLDRLPNARLLLAGAGPARLALEAQARRHGIDRQIDMTGHLDKAEMAKRFAAVWVQAVPSIWPEPFPNVAIEAMMRGTAVVASTLGGLPEIVAHGETGLLVPARDPERLANALIQVAGNRDVAERMGANGRERAQQVFGLPRMVKRFEDLYARMAA